MFRFSALRQPLVIGLVAVSSAALAQSSAQGEVSVTIYNNNLALVQDVRPMNLSEGRSRQEFPDVSAQIQPQTVTLSGIDIGIVEQNFDYDLLSPDKLMEKAVGQTITIVRTNPATGAETREQAKVLAANGGIVLQIGNRIEVLRDDGLPVRVVFDKVPDNLRARPTLSVTLQTARGGPRPVALSYLTSGLGWNADYVALFDEAKETIDVQGWVTLTNTSGTTYTNARTLLVAGNPSGQGGNYPRYGGQMNGAMTRAGTETANRERLGDFYLYPIKERTTIANAQTKQVSFLNVTGVPARKAYEYRLGWMQSYQNPVSVATVIKFSSAGKGGLGDALPAGTMRFYLRDARGQPQFIGENSIGHTPMGSELAIGTGSAFDVMIKPALEKREQIDSNEWESTARYRIFKSDGTSQTVDVQQQKQFWRSTMRYTFTNAKPTSVTVEFVQSGLNPYYYARDSRISAETQKGEQLSADERQWKVVVPANGSVDLVVTYVTRH
jgi:hypothetical protein